jgi:hypothetical protein
MTTALLQVVEQSHDLVSRGDAMLLFQEFAVNRNLAPFLVSAGKEELLWVERTFGGGVIRAAMRDDRDLTGIYRQVLRMVAQRGVRLQYGNTHPFTLSGLEAAVRYVRYYDIPDVVILVPIESPFKATEIEVEGVDVQILRAGWLPEGVAVAVPENRAYLGDLHLYGKKAYAVVIHNAIRAVSLAIEEGHPLLIQETVDVAEPDTRLSDPDGGGS